VSQNAVQMAEQGVPGPSPHRIVLIEDNPADTMLLRHALDEVGEPYMLEILTDGEAALRFVREHCRPNSAEPCLIVLDLHLPLHDGTTVLRAIRSEPDLAKVAVAVLTSSVSPAEKAEVLSLGVQAYRPKPMDLDDTFELARELVEICKQPVNSELLPTA
jgi:CheY-like chemotaxis protein